MGKYTKTEPYKLTAGVMTRYKQWGLQVIKCSRCGREIHVGDKYVRRGKLWKKNARAPMTLKFYCEECWKKLYVDLPDVTEEEIERGEVLTIPFFILNEVKLKW